MSQCTAVYQTHLTQLGAHLCSAACLYKLAAGGPGQDSELWQNKRIISNQMHTFHPAQPQQRMVRLYLDRHEPR